MAVCWLYSRCLKDKFHELKPFFINSVTARVFFSYGVHVRYRLFWFTSRCFVFRCKQKLHSTDIVEHSFVIISSVETLIVYIQNTHICHIFIIIFAHTHPFFHIKHEYFGSFSFSLSLSLSPIFSRLFLSLALSLSPILFLLLYLPFHINRWAWVIFFHAIPNKTHQKIWKLSIDALYIHSDDRFSNIDHFKHHKLLLFLLTFDSFVRWAI